jgi:hypothetical protein
LKIKKNNKDKAFLLFVAIVLTLSILWVGNYFWKQENFRKWICEVSTGTLCYDTKLVIHHLPDSGDRAGEREHRKKMGAGPYKIEEN